MVELLSVSKNIQEVTLCFFPVVHTLNLKFLTMLGNTENNPSARMESIISFILLKRCSFANILIIFKLT